jgi:dienelactone hydrolase
MLRRAPILVGLIALGCAGETSSQGLALSLGGPAIHFFVTGTEVTESFLPEAVHVRLTGLPPASRVTLRASMPGYASHAGFRADAEGSVDVAAQAPLEGTYQGADADGLFWSMVATAAPPASPSEDIDVTVRAEVDGAEVATATLARHAVAGGLVETEVRDDGLFATFVTPATPGPHPALLTFGGSEGGISTGLKVARLYSSLGYSCLGLAYFKEDGLPPELGAIPLEYFGKALAWMQARPEVKADAIGVLGASRGGELALILGATNPAVKAVVAHVPSGVSWPGSDPQHPEKEGSAWTLGGHGLPFVSAGDTTPVFTTDAQGRTIEDDTPAFLAALAATSPATLAAATTRVEKARGPVLMLAAGDDEIWPSCKLARIAMDRLVAAGHAASFADDLQCYPGAGHVLGVPGLPTTDPQLFQGAGDVWIALGGTPAGVAHAARDAFERKRGFLAAALR